MPFNVKGLVYFVFTETHTFIFFSKTISSTFCFFVLCCLWFNSIPVFSFHGDHYQAIGSRALYTQQEQEF